MSGNQRSSVMVRPTPEMSLALVWKDLSLEQVETITGLLNDKEKAEQFSFSQFFYTYHLFFFSNCFNCSLDGFRRHSIFLSKQTVQML